MAQNDKWIETYWGDSDQNMRIVFAQLIQNDYHSKNATRVEACTTEEGEKWKDISTDEQATEYLK